MASPGEPAQPLGPRGDADLLHERDRIAAELQHQVIQRVFAVGLNLQGTAAMVADPLARHRVEQAVGDLDHVVQLIRDAVFHLQAHLTGPGLRAGIVHLCDQLSPVPEVTFHGPVDGALPPLARTELLDILHDALAVLHRHWAPVHVHVTAAGGAHVTVLQAVRRPGAQAAAGPGQEFPGLRQRAAQAGMRIDIQQRPESVQIRWHAA
jgi:signal transduction histidine kinase